MNNWIARCVKKNNTTWNKGDIIVVEDGLVIYQGSKTTHGWLGCTDKEELALKSFRKWCEYQNPSEWIEINDINDIDNFIHSDGGKIKSKPKKLSAKKAIKLFMETYLDNDKQIDAYGEILAIVEISDKYTPKEIVDILTKYDEERKNGKKKKR